MTFMNGKRKSCEGVVEWNRKAARQRWSKPVLFFYHGHGAPGISLCPLVCQTYLLYHQIPLPPPIYLTHAVCLSPSPADGWLHHDPGSMGRLMFFDFSFSCNPIHPSRIFTGVSRPQVTIQSLKSSVHDWCTAVSSGREFGSGLIGGEASRGGQHVIVLWKGGLLGKMVEGRKCGCLR